MRAVGLLLISAWPLMAAIGRAETRFPYQVTIPAGGVELRSGPGPSFYATDRLAGGERIEVYREEKDGWLAVRPPAGCFSLMERRQLKPADEPNVAVVTAEDALCCVGSRVEAVEAYVSQVQLRKGERVELLDKWDADQKSAADSSQAAWCRIWPPAGEFRWLKADDLKRAPPAATDTTSADQPATDQKPAIAPRTSFEADGWQARPATATPARPSPEPASAASQAAVGATPEIRASASKPPPADANAGWTATQSEREHAKTANNAADPQPKSSTAVQIRVPADTEKVIAPTGLSHDSPSSRTSPPSHPITSWTSRTPPPRQPIEELELELSMMVAGEMGAWRLADLRQRVDANVLRYETTADRVRARQLLERIAEFEQLQGRMTATAPAASAAKVNAAPASAVPAATAENAAPAEIATDAATVKYDGSGWLVPVHSSTGTTPPFALLDAQGEVLGYVSPTPGLNLQRYLRKQVGIFGQRGYVPSLNKPHVTAERIVDLDRHLR